MRRRDLNLEQQAALKVEPDVGGQGAWDPDYNGGGCVRVMSFPASVYPAPCHCVVPLSESGVVRRLALSRLNLHFCKSCPYDALTRNAPNILDTIPHCLFLYPARYSCLYQYLVFQVFLSVNSGL